MLKSIVSFLLLPGIVAYLVPVLLLWATGDLRLAQPAGLLLLLAGTTVLIWCTVEFHRAGKGTLAPWSPPEHLVVSGPYRFSRNPMYVGVLLILLGWSLSAWSPLLLAYAAACAIGFHLRTVLGEEPRLAALFGSEWSEYASSTRRWL